MKFKIKSLFKKDITKIRIENFYKNKKNDCQLLILNIF
ncbi:hypothetical protein CLV61_2016, partial [Capnocytophaga canimorsus]